MQRRATILIQSNNKYTFTFTFTFTLVITLPTILISTNYTFTLSSNLQLQITNTINHYIANYKSRIENTTQAIAKVTAMRSNSMKTNKTFSKENIKLHEFVAMKSLIYIFSNIWFNNKQIILLGFICSLFIWFDLIWFDRTISATNHWKSSRIIWNENQLHFRFSNEVVTKREMLLQVKKTQTCKSSFILFNSILFYFHRNIR